jgi:hypothetical protein
MADLRQILPGAMVVLALSSVRAAAQDEAAGPAGTELTLPPIEVVGATPLLGSGVDRNKAETHVLTNQDISRKGLPAAASRVTPGTSSFSARNACG